MKILVVGASGTLGRAVAQHLGERHQVITAGRNSGEHRVDLRDDASVGALFAATGRIDAIVSAAGSVHFGPAPARKRPETSPTSPNDRERQVDHRGDD